MTTTLIKHASQTPKFHAVALLSELALAQSASASALLYPHLLR